MSVAGEQRTHEDIGHLRGSVSALAENLNRFIQDSKEQREYDNQRFDKLEGKINEKFPYIQFASLLVACFAVAGALFNVSLNPLFTDTERNRLSDIAQNEVLREQASVATEFTALEKEVTSQRAWLESLTNIERDRSMLFVSHIAKSEEHQAEAEKDRIRMEKSLVAQAKEDLTVASRLSAIEAKAKALEHRVRELDFSYENLALGRP